MKLCKNGTLDNSCKPDDGWHSRYLVIIIDTPLCCALLKIQELCMHKTCQPNWNSRTEPVFLLFVYLWGPTPSAVEWRQREGAVRVIDDDVYKETLVNDHLSTLTKLSCLFFPHPIVSRYSNYPNRDRILHQYVDLTWIGAGRRANSSFLAPLV